MKSAAWNNELDRGRRACHERPKKLCRLAVRSHGSYLMLVRIMLRTLSKAYALRL